MAYGCPPQAVTARFVMDGEEHEVRYGPGGDFESPMDFFPPCKASLRRPCQGMLGLLESLGALSGLPLDAAGCLHVALPFCGSAQELPVLSEFLTQQVLGRNGVRQISMLGSDVEDWGPKGGYWQQKELFARRRTPHLRLRFAQLDLAATQHPAASLMFAIHPECTVNREMWRRILGNIISATQGLCVVATFAEDEAKVVADVGHSLQRRCQIHLNPFYGPGCTAPPPPSMKYIVLVAK
ncbi:unnamed protein product [Effrenium voratum]|uniref:Uncharacterized protein n=1 Tax=Effrenium voratum TaxID=2562239 RepID=A0AA36N7L7_9DINO|nr:unnamed protein product [Effrenium voratum]